MGLLYDVTYPGRRSLDREVGYDYLDRLARDRRNNGARAVCINGERHTIVLRDGEWVDAEPQRSK